MKNNKIDEFLNRNINIDIIERFIFFDGKWMFPEKESLSAFLDVDIQENDIELSNNIIKYMNDMNIDPETYNKDIFNYIIKNL